MGGAHGKTTHIASPIMAPPAYDAHDPRSPSLKRTPISTPEDWRYKAARARVAAQQEDPRSPGVERTPLAEHHTISDPVTPLTLSYDNCSKIEPNDPRSPMQFRTPLNCAQGIPKFDTAVVECAPFIDDTVIISNVQEPVETNELDETISVSSGTISSPLAGMTIVSTSTEVAPLELNNKEVEEVQEVDSRKALVQSEQDIEVPSSPLGASACRLEDSDAKVVVSSPALPADRKRKMTKQLIGVSPLKKSYSSPTQNENDENASPIIAPARRTTPTTPRRSPVASRHKRTPSGARSSNLKNSEGPKSPRSPLSPLVQRNVDVPPAFVL